MVGFNMHDWAPIKVHENVNVNLNLDVFHFHDMECSVCGLRKHTNTDESKLDDCFTVICKTVMEEEEPKGWSATENIVAASYNPRGLTKLKIKSL